MKPDDVAEIGELTPGVGVRVVLIATVERLEQAKYEEDGETTGSLHLQVKEFKVTKESNQFMALAEDDD